MRFPLTVARLSLASAVALTASTAFAARVAVLVPKLDSDAQTSEGKRNKFHDSLTAGIADGAQAGTTVIPATEVRKALAGKPELLSCTQSGCASVAAAQLQADRVVTSELQVRETVGGAAYTIKVSVYDATGATTGITANERCGNIGDGCNVKRAYEALTRATASIAAKTMEMKPTETAPTPAPVTPPPSPEMQLKDPMETTPSATSTPAPSSVSATPDAQPSQPSGPYNPGYRYGWIAAATIGGLFVASSIPFFYFASKEGTTNCGANIPAKQCPQVYQGNLAPALGLLVGGGLASATAFAVLFYLDKRELRRSSGTKTALVPVLHGGGAGLSLIGRF